MVSCHVFRWVHFHFGLSWQAWLGLPTTKQYELMTDLTIDWLLCEVVLLWVSESPLHVLQRRVTVQYYRDNILTPFVVLFARRVGRSFVFQDDNVHAHRALTVNAHFQQHNIFRMPRPAMSPDLSPHWTHLGHERETCVSMSKIADHVTWTLSSAAREVEQTPSNGGHWANHTQYAWSTEWTSNKSWRYHPLLIK